MITGDAPWTDLFVLGVGEIIVSIAGVTFEEFPHIILFSFSSVY